MTAKASVVKNGDRTKTDKIDMIANDTPKNICDLLFITLPLYSKISLKSCLCSVRKTCFYLILFRVFQNYNDRPKNADTSLLEVPIVT